MLPRPVYIVRRSTPHPGGFLMIILAIAGYRLWEEYVAPHQTELLTIGAVVLGLIVAAITAVYLLAAWRYLKTVPYRRNLSRHARLFSKPARGLALTTGRVVDWHPTIVERIRHNWIVMAIDPVSRAMRIGDHLGVEVAVDLDNLTDVEEHDSWNSLILTGTGSAEPHTADFGNNHKQLIRFKDQFERVLSARN